MFDSLCNDLLIKCCVSFTPDVTGVKYSQKFDFRQSAEYFPKSREDHQDVSLANVR